MATEAHIRTPLDVIALVVDEETAKKVETRLLAALRCAHGTMIREEDKSLNWCHVDAAGTSWEIVNRERGFLIDKKIVQDLTEEEEVLLKMLTIYADYFLAKVSPRSGWDEIKVLLEKLTADTKLPRITVKTEAPLETGVKKFDLPEKMKSSLIVKCPECGDESRLIWEYMDYPVAGAFLPVTTYCGNDHCGHTWKVNVRLDFVLTVEDPTLVLPPAGEDQEDVQG